MKPPVIAQEGVPGTVLVNGRRDCAISVRDRGLHFGDGVFETISCRMGRPRFIDMHLERLADGCHRLRIPLEFDGVSSTGNALRMLRDEVRMLASEAMSSIVKLIVTRGEAEIRGYGFSGREIPARVLLRYSWPEESPERARDGVLVGISTLRLGENPALAGLKHLNRLEQILARADWPDRAAAEMLLFSGSGRLISGTMTNVFLVREGHVLTPKIDLCGVAGVMRRVVMREARSAGISVEERTLTREDLEQAEELFLTSSRVGIWPVRRLEARILSPGPVTRRLQRLLGPMLEDPVDA